MRKPKKSTDAFEFEQCIASAQKGKQENLATENAEITEVKRKAQSCCNERMHALLCALCDLCGKSFLVPACPGSAHQM
jgi:hypothetical protein